MQVLPTEALRGIIKHYLFLDSTGLVSKQFRLFSDGNPGMVFSNNSGLSINNTYTLPASFLYGQISEFKDILLSANTSLIIVVFQPSGVRRLLGIPAFELCDNIIDVIDIFGSKGLLLERQLADSKSSDDKQQRLNQFFSSLVSEQNNPKDLCISATIQYIVQNRGLVSSGQLIKFTGYTERHLERIFLETIGTNPKNFTKIVRLHNFLQQLKTKREKETLTEIAYSTGYTDQSHLIKEFKKYTGMTPTRYANVPAKLAINFVTLPGSVR